MAHGTAPSRGTAHVMAARDGGDQLRSDRAPVSVMQSTEDGLGKDSALFRGFDAARQRGVVIQRLARLRGSDRTARELGAWWPGRAREVGSAGQRSRGAEQSAGGRANRAGRQRAGASASRASSRSRRPFCPRSGAAAVHRQVVLMQRLRCFREGQAVPDRSEA